MTSPGSGDGCPWMVREGLFRRVVGFREAVELLNDPRLHADFAGLFAQAGSVPDAVLDQMQTSLLSTNGAEHRRLRQLIAARFTPRAVEHVRPLLNTEARRLAEPVAERGGGEFISEFAGPYVAMGTCAHVGFPFEDRERFTAEVTRLGHAAKDLHRRMPEAVAAIEALDGYAGEVLARRSQEPSDDVLSLVADLQRRGAVTGSVARGLVAGFLSAGLEPTVNQLGIMLEVLADHPDVWDALGSGRLAAARVVEETLRFRSTNQGVNRLVTEPVDHRGQHLPQGHQVLIGVAAANHDPVRFPDAGSFDPTVDRLPHLAFGIGPHHCLGAALARVQLQEALSVLTAVMTCPEVTERVEETGAGLIGPASLRVRCRLRRTEHHRPDRSGGQ